MTTLEVENHGGNHAATVTAAGHEAPEVAHPDPFGDEPFDPSRHFSCPNHAEPTVRSSGNPRVMPYCTVECMPEELLEWRMRGEAERVAAPIPCPVCEEAVAGGDYYPYCSRRCLDTAQADFDEFLRRDAEEYPVPEWEATYDDGDPEVRYAFRVRRGQAFGESDEGTLP